MSTPKPPAGTFTILYFASATSYTKRSHDFLPAPLPITQLFDLLEQKYPGIKKKVLESSALTVNLEYVDLEEEGAKKEGGMEGGPGGGLPLVVREGDEVAVIPPVSSG